MCKAWCLVARTWLDFQRATVAVAADGGFTARILVPVLLTGFTGRWATANGLIVTAITVYRGNAVSDDEECA